MLETDSLINDQGAYTNSLLELMLKIQQRITEHYR